MGKTAAPHWEDKLARFEASAARRRVFTLSSPGVAQVTRARLIAAYQTRVRMRTEGRRMVWEKPGADRVRG